MNKSISGRAMKTVGLRLKPCYHSAITNLSKEYGNSITKTIEAAIKNLYCQQERIEDEDPFALEMLYQQANLSERIPILNNKFFEQPYEIVFRSLSESIRLIGKRYYLVRGKKIDNIIKFIKNNKSYKSTLGGCIIEKVDQTVIISKEYTKI